ncbi:FACT complex subunit SSRP1 [Ciona intestinalis]
MTENGQFLDYKNVFQENRGAMHDGRLQLLKEKIVFKNNKTGKIDSIQQNDLHSALWRRVARDFEIKFQMNSGQVFRFDGFKEMEFERLKDFVKNYYKIDLEHQELSGKGWNWGTTDFEGNEMMFQVGQKLSFEIPLNNVSQCTQNKDEVTMEFHQNDDSELSLMEMRFFIPPSQDEMIDKVKDFHDNVMAKADVLQVKGTAICVFQDLQCLTPRGRYDIRMYPKFIQLHGKTFDYKITYTSILRLFLLPHKDQRQIFFVVSLDPPLKQGMTRYHFLILLFYKEDDLAVELSLPDDEIEERFGGKLQKDMSGPMYEVVSRVMKHLVQRKITVPGSFKGLNGVQSITCTYKASSGFLFPLERGFMYVHKPPVHIRFDEIAYVNFARGTTKINKSFDFEIETRSKNNFVFSNIERDQYASLYDFVHNKQLKIKNIGKDGADFDLMVDSDEDADVHDPYMERMKQEAADREKQVDDDDDDESEDDDFQPETNVAEVEEEFNSDVGSASSGASEEEEEEVEEKPKKRKKEKVVKERRQKESGKSKRKKKDPNAPKRPQSAYFLWLNDNRGRFKAENKGISITELSKLAGKEWKKIDPAEKQKFERMYQKSKVKFDAAMKEYKSQGGGNTSSSPAKKMKMKSPKPSKASSSTVSPSKFKSKEFITESDSLSSSDSDAEVKSKSPPPAEEESASESEDASEEEESD